MEKKIYQISYFISVMVIQNNVLGMILEQNIPFVYPNHECTLPWKILVLSEIIFFKLKFGKKFPK